MSDVHHRRPAEPLASYIESLWMHLPQAHSDEHITVLPDGISHLVVTLDGTPLQVSDGAQAEPAFRSVPTPMLFNAGVRPMYVDFPRESMAPAMGVRFKPGGLQAFVAGHVSALCKGVIPLQDVWGDDVRDWAARLGAAPDVEAAFDALEALLMKQLRVAPGERLPMQAAAVHLGVAEEPSPLAQVAARFGLGHRQFTAAFKNGTGLTPKMFARLARFGAALRALDAQGKRQGTEVAMDCHYFDQAHFAHEFKTLAGMTPTDYRAARGEHDTCLFTKGRKLWRALTGTRQAEVIPVPAPELSE